MTTTIEIPAGTNVLNVTKESNRILLEFVPKFKEGDFLYSNAYAQETILIFKKIYNNHLYYHICMEDGDCLDFCETNYWTNIDDFRLATEAEQQQLLYMMKKDGKQWNAEKLCIEDIPVYKKGDIVTYKYSDSDKQGVLIFNTSNHSQIHFFAAINRLGTLCLNDYFVNIEPITITGIANEEHSSKIVSALKDEGKQWNPTKLCIENIPQRKFKQGDKVKVKDEMLYKEGESPYFVDEMRVFIGEVLTVGGYTHMGDIYLNEAKGWNFAEDWLELYSDILEKGDLAIFWDYDKKYSKIGICEKNHPGNYVDHTGTPWLNAIKFESKEQFEDFLEHIKD